jgi:hypothetical protein
MLNTEQQTRIQQTVLASANVPRVSRVDFALSVNTVVPTHVTIVDAPPALIEINPAWRGHKYFVVEEEIIVVTPERRIVAVIPTRARAAGTGTGTSVAVDLSPDEIRIMQQVLVERGFSVQVNGVFDTGTREALVAFQQREGLQATGQVDTRTVTALGVQGRIRASGDAATGTVGTGGQPSQTGAQQQPAQQQQPPAQQQGQQQPGATPQQQTTGTAQPQQQQPPAQQQGQQQGAAPQQQTTGAAPGQQQPQQGTTGSAPPAQQQQQPAQQQPGTEMQRQPDKGGGSTPQR